MKLLAKIFLALLMTGLLCIPVLQRISTDFLHDTISLHGSSISGNPTTIQAVTVDWRKQSVEISGLDISLPLSGKSTPSVLVNSSRLQWDKMLRLQPASNNIIPDVLSLDTLTLQDLVIVYDADSEGGNLIPLRKSIADSTNTYLRQRLNASNNNSTEMPQRFTIRSLELQDIRIDARSALDNTRQKTFKVNNLQYTNVGMPENGISMAEIINRITEDLAVAIHQQALAQGVIKPAQTTAVTSTEKPARNKVRADTTSPEYDNSKDTESPHEESKTKKAVKNTGDAIKKLSRKLFGDKG